MTPMSPMCLKCEHFHYNNLISNTCEAYPQGIPDEILDGKVIHTSSYNGDNGLTYKKKQ
jgi:hypothetical protein